MRDLSIPPWTILREPSSSSAAPSEPEDELQEQSFQERMAPPSRTLPQPVAGPSSSRATYGGRGVTGNSTLGPQAFSSAPRPPIPSTSSGNPRRPLSSSDEEATDRPKKKKKRKIIDPEKGAAFANTKVSLSGTPSASATRPSPIQLKLPSTARSRGLNSLRRVTLDIGSLDQTVERNLLRAGNQNINKQISETFLPLSSAPIGPLLKKYKPQVESTSSSEQGSSSSNGTIGVNDRRSKSSSSHRASPTSAPASPPRQASSKPPPAADVIVLDEDEDAPLPPPIQRRVSAPALPLSREVIEVLDSDEEPAPTPAKTPAKSTHKQTQKRALPRRSTFRKPPQPPKFREENGVIAILDSDDGEEVPPPSPCQERIEKESISAAPVSNSPRSASSSTLMEEAVNDIDMVADDPVEPDTSVRSPEAADEQVEEGTPGPADNPSAQGATPAPVDVHEVELSSAADQAHVDDVPPDIAGPTDLLLPPAVGDSTEAIATLETGPSTLTVSSSSDPDALPVGSLERDTSSPVAPVEKLDLLREETASPVHSFLDPCLQSLTIAGTSSGQQPPLSMASRSACPTPPGESKEHTNCSDFVPPASSPRFLKPYSGSAHRPQLRRRTSRCSQSTGGATTPFVPTTSVRDSPVSSTITRFSDPPEELVEEPIAVPQQEFPMEGIIVTQELEHFASVVQDRDTDQDMDIGTDEPSTALQSSSSEAPDTKAGTAVAQNEPVNEETDSKAETSSTSTVPVTSMAHTTDGLPRSDTAPLEYPKAGKELGPTLSQVIRAAQNDLARCNPIDLTDLDDDLSEPVQSGPANESARAGAQTPAPLLPLPTAVSATPESIKTVDLNSIRAIRKLASARKSQQYPLMNPTPMKHPTQVSSIKAKGPIPPLPRNMRRISGTQGSSASAPTSHSTPASIVQNVAASHTPTPVASSSAPVTPIPSFSHPPLKLALPRRHAVKPLPPHPDNESLTLRIPPLPRTLLGSRHTIVEAAVSTDTETAASVPLVDSCGESVPCSPTEPDHVDGQLLDLEYPSSTPEDSPDIDLEMLDEDEQPIRAPTGRRARQAVSEASSSSSGPRRSARLSSGSASSSVEPPELHEAEPRMRLRRRHREPNIRTSSEDEVASHGGITHRSQNKFSQAFETAGFGAVSWRKDRQRIAKEHAPITQLAENIPHDLHDRLNALPTSARQAGNMQVLIFEAEIRHNTVVDEPQAPPIAIINEVDDEPTPPLEFYYSNLMWHGKGVPKPDYDNLQGCDCVGPCDPMSKTCSCVRRQKEVMKQSGLSGFIYDKKGRLRATEYPVFECNMNCGCSDDCLNRVIQHGRRCQISIRKTPNKGWGIFAGSKIPANSYVGVYAGEYLLDADGEARGRVYNRFGRTYLFDIDFYFLKPEYGHDQTIYCIDAYHAGNFTRYLNHSCDPNCVIVAAYINEANLDKPLLTIFTQKDVEADEELCFSYFGEPDNGDEDNDSDSEPPMIYDEAVYVECKCGAENCRGRMWK